MAPAVTDRDRWLALGLLALAVLLAYAVLVHPWWTAPMLEVNQRIEELRERELRIRTQLQQAPQVQRQLQAALAQQAQRPGFLPEATVELATAGLVQRLEAIVKQASPGNRSCAIANQSPLAMPGRENFARVVVQVRLRCGAPEFASVLHQIESGSPRLFVENLNVLAQRYAFQASESGTGGLDINFDLYGYLTPAPVGPAPAPATPTAPMSTPPVQGGVDAP